MDPEESDRAPRQSLRSRLMSKHRVFEMPPALQRDYNDDNAFVPFREFVTHPPPNLHSETKDTVHAVEELGDSLDRLSLQPSQPEEGTSIQPSCPSRSKDALHDRPNPIAECIDDDIFVDEDTVIFNSTMECIKAGIDPEIGSLKPHDIACLDHELLLNDEIINAFMQLLQRHQTSMDCHFFNSFFLPRLTAAKSYDDVKKWTSPGKLRRWGQKKESILDVDRIFFPYFACVHWSLVVADLRDNTITLYDSIASKAKRLKSHVKQAMLAIEKYLVNEAEDKKQEDWSDRVFSFQSATHLPQQSNGSDCGVFMVQFAKRLSTNVALSFSHEQISGYRIQMLKELQQDRIL